MFRRDVQLTAALRCSRTSNGDLLPILIACRDATVEKDPYSYFSRTETDESETGAYTNIEVYFLCHCNVQCLVIVIDRLGTWVSSRCSGRRLHQTLNCSEILQLFIMRQVPPMLLVNDAVPLTFMSDLPFLPNERVRAIRPDLREVPRKSYGHELTK